MPDYYILDEEHHVQPASLMQWAMFFKKHDKRIVEQTTLNDIVLVSTVFVGIPLNFGDGPPLLFESMVFDLTMDAGGTDQWRYASWDDAEVGHKALVRRVKAQLAKIEMPVLPGD